jgi:hypothetical protein
MYDGQTGVIKAIIYAQIFVNIPTIFHLQTAGTELRETFQNWENDRVLTRP